jgi:cytochrome P450
MPTLTDYPVLDIDPFDESVLPDPIATHALIREAGPVVLIPKYDIFFVGRDAETREVLNDWRRFSSTFGIGVVNIKRDGAWQKPSVIVEVDPPDHTVTRRVLNKVLSPRAMRKLQDDFQLFADRLVDELIERRTFDAIADLSFRFPFTVLPDAVGLPHEGRDHLATYSAMYFNTRIPNTRLALESSDAAIAAGSLEWIADACKRQNISSGGFGEQIYAAADAGEIDEATAGSLVRTFLGGGVDTTVLTIGSMLHGLIGDPRQWQLLHERRELIRPAFDEALRLWPPVPIMGRTTPAPTELAGVQLPAEQKLFAMIGAANRDPRKWERPDEFDITRKTAGHLGFGVGPHFCVGHAIARLEAEVVLTTLLDKLDHIELAGEPVPELSNWLYGLRELPVTVHPR